jgi:hypothetical protein
VAGACPKSYRGRPSNFVLGTFWAREIKDLANDEDRCTREKSIQSNLKLPTPGSLSLLLLIFLSRFENRLRDGAVGAAAADVSAQPFGDLLSGGIGIVHQQCLRRHDLPGRAITALGADVADECFLDRI